ncbi:class I SAM-dependent methyltransferase [Agrobacterium larrymoorei]|uniref:class I SAM-dependent methyltransferase n=1 Tax=Agrobacterium larrymoorei TaxID=160699 RepID=UPI0015729E7E|nr:class I SAM-dependent methyltransferase [Agrobacterium larrymoorei]NTJ43606.1 class I SAM-dependent methyltransferase [Agrobacterium larrymoorei]
MRTELQKHYRYDEAANIWARPNGGESFKYSDGDEVENRVYRIIKSASDKSVLSVPLKSAITDWPSLYHLSPLRANLMRPIVKSLEGPVLEIGCGCGAITRFLGEEGLEVVALEGSTRRAMITAERCRDLKTVEVLAEPFQNFMTDRKFKTVTLIGVLEYARVFFPSADGRDPVDLMLERAAELLEPDGVLIVAIENQLGLKYFAGYNEDHLAKPMVGIEGNYNSSTVVTFGKKELDQRLRTAGLGEQEWWFPFPDYKLPITVISEDALVSNDMPVDIAAMIGEACRADRQAPEITTFSLDLAWSAITRNGLAADLANSFLIVAGRQKRNAGDVFAYHYGHTRLPQYAKVVEFRHEEGSFAAVRKALSKTPASPVPGAPQLKETHEPLVGGEIWRDRLRLLMQRQGWSQNDIALWAKVWWLTVTDIYKQDLESVPYNKHTLLPPSAIDAIPRNLIVQDNVHITFIDQEWSAPGPIELGYLFYRGAVEALSGVDFCVKPASELSTRVLDLLIVMARAIEIELNADDLLRYANDEFALQESVSGNPTVTNAQQVLTRVIAERKPYYDIIKRQHAAILQQQKQIKDLTAHSEYLKASSGAVKGALQSGENDEWNAFLRTRSDS